MRWRTEREVVSGKGQFTCGNVRCEEQHSLTTYEVHFAYVEQGEHKSALVKVRLCLPCADKMTLARGKRLIEHPSELDDVSIPQGP
jgi:protein FRA10AC1